MLEVIKPVVNVVTMTSSGTEYSWQVPANCVGVSFQCRDATDVFVAFTAGAVAGPSGNYFTLKSGTAYTLPDSLLFNKDQVPYIYFGCGTAGKVIEIIYLCKA